MQFFKKYDQIYGASGINENANQAKRILQEKGIDPTDPKFVELRDVILKRQPGYLGLFTKFVFDEGTSLEEIRQVLHLVNVNKDTLGKLSKPVIEYSDYHELLDDVSKLEKERVARKILNNVVGDLRRELFELEPEKLQLFIDLAARVAEFDEKEVKVFTQSISRIKDLDELSMDMELFISKMTDDLTISKITNKIENTEFSKVVYKNPETGVIVARIGEYIDSYYLGSFNWCISKDGGIDSWNSYVEKEGNIQYFVWNTSVPKSDPMYMVGITVRQDGTIRNCQNAQNSATDFNSMIKEFGLEGKNIFVGLTPEELAEKEASLIDRNARIKEFQEKQAIEKAKRRAERMEERRNDSEWENDPMAHAMREFLVDEGIMDADEDVYALEEENYKHYGLRLFKYNDNEFAIGTDEEVDAAAVEYLESLFEEAGFTFVRGYEDHLKNDEILKDIREYYDESIREDPENWGVEKTVSESTQEKIDEINSQLEDLNDQRGNLDEEEDADEYSNLTEQIESLESELSDLESEDDDFSESDIEAKIEEMTDQWSGNPIDYYKDEIGYGPEDLANLIKKNDWVDIDSLVQYCIDSDGRAHNISSYDGEEHDVEFEGETYYVYRIN